MIISPTSSRHSLNGCHVPCVDQVAAPVTKISRARYSSRRPMLLAVALSLAVALQAVAPTQANYNTQGRFSVNTEGGSFITREDLPSTQLDISDSDTSIGGVGNIASAGYAVSITNAALSASASAQNALFGPGNYWSASADADGVLLYDDLRFTIPAGDYPSGVYVEARVHVEGSVAVSGVGATARHIYGIYFGSGAVLVVTDAPAPPVSADIVLTAELASPGVTFINPVTFLRRFTASVENHAGAGGEVAQTSSSSLAINVTCLVIPPNVTWIADSGAFGAPECSAIDSDADGVTDDVDNCLLVPNADQRDTNADDIGNICDPDIDNDCNVNFSDINAYKSNFFAPGDLDTDNNGDGITNFADLNTVKSYFFGPPGPSATGCN